MRPNRIQTETALRSLVSWTIEGIEVLVQKTHNRGTTHFRGLTLETYRIPVEQNMKVEDFKKLLGPGKYGICGQIDRYRLFYGIEMKEGTIYPVCCMK